MRRKRRSRVALLAAAAISVAAAGCGAEDFPNDPRPPTTLELSALIDGKRVVVAPTQIDGAPIGAGLANFTISNQTSKEVTLDFDGPTQSATAPVVPNGTSNHKVELEEGTYSVEPSDSTLKAAELVIGPERETGANDLLLP